MTSFTPRKPRSANERRKAFQNGSASEAPVATPNTSRRPSVFTPTAIITATETIRPAWRDFRYVASIHRYGQAPSMGRLRKAFTRSSISAHNRETWLFEMPDAPMALTRSSTARVQKGREVGALAQLGDGEVNPPSPRVPAALAIAVAVVEPLGAAHARRRAR